MQPQVGLAQERRQVAHEAPIDGISDESSMNAEGVRSMVSHRNRRPVKRLDQLRLEPCAGALMVCQRLIQPQLTLLGSDEDVVVGNARPLAWNPSGSCLAA